MLLRRIKDKSDFGTDVIMRYTLRLLTAQQFHRASGLICSLEHIRKNNLNILGDHEFSIGIWIGGDSTYNTCKQAHSDFKKIERPLRGKQISLNKFHITSCPWCAAQFTVENYEQGRNRIYGLKENFKEKKIYSHCPDSKCEFKTNNCVIESPDSFIFSPNFSFRPRVISGSNIQSLYLSSF